MHEAKQKKVMTRGQTWHEANKREIPKIYPRSDTKTYHETMQNNDILTITTQIPDKDSPKNEPVRRSSRLALKARINYKV